MVRSVSDPLKAAQSAASRVPYVHMVFTSYDAGTTYDLSTNSAAYGNRILLIDHAEEAYNDYAVVTLRDYDRTLPNLLGYWTEIGYGDVTGSNEYAATSRLWVKHQQHISAAGKLLVILELEGMWAKLGETMMRMGSPPYYTVKNADEDFGGSEATIYGILEYIIENEIDPSMYLDALSEDDGIINSLKPVFEVNSAQQFEYAQTIVGYLIRMTKSFLRAKDGMAWEVKYPQDTDVDDLTYYSNQSPYFYEYVEKKNLLVPNRIYVIANAQDDGLFYPATMVTGQADEATSQGLYGIVPLVVTAPWIDNQADADARAAAILQRWRAEWVGGRLIIPHDCQMELYDRLAMVDSRGF